MPFKYLSNFLKTLETLSISRGIRLIQTWSPNCFISNSTGAWIFAVTDIKVYLPVVALSSQGNVKILEN